MEFKIIHKTVDLLGNNGDTTGIDSMLAIGGREAGICYMPDDYFSEKINNSKTALSRANTILSTGHHSPFDHASIGLEISGIPKIVAMILNSTEFYTTSEKSARYTVMKPETALELNIYEKWQDIFKEEIGRLKLKDATDKDIDKLALENARYMLSVFTPTSMGYTTTFRQFSYLAQWLKKFVDELKKRPNEFNRRLIEPCTEIFTYFIQLTNEAVKDHKNREIEFMPAQVGRDIPTNEFIGDVYQINYLASFAQLAQEQRHRTLHYEMMFTGEPGEYSCYIPKILIGTKYEREWLDDFDMLKDQYPQCTQVRVLEQGRAYWFFMKCKERLCGRAQLEIQEQTKATMQKFIDNRDNLGGNMQHMLDSVTKDGKVIPKCMMEGYTCQEPCRWGSKNGIDRLI